MLSAHEAKEISKQNTPVDIIMKDIEKRIKDTARQGGTELLYECRNNTSTEVIAEIVSKMRNIYGYKVAWAFGLKAFLINW